MRDDKVALLLWCESSESIFYLLSNKRLGYIRLLPIKQGNLPLRNLLHNCSLSFLPKLETFKICQLGSLSPVLIYLPMEGQLAF